MHTYKHLQALTCTHMHLHTRTHTCAHTGSHWRQAIVALKPPRRVVAGEQIRLKIAVGAGLNHGTDVTWL